VTIVHASYYTDPACPRSWGIEPALRRLQVEFGEEVQITYVMGGLAREFGDPAALVAEWLDVAEASGMPVDPRLWLASPPRSSYPACMAVKAAAEQGRAGAYLRRLREGLLCERHKLDHAEAFVHEARSVPGIDVDRFAVDLGSHAIVEAFGADLERTRERGAELPFLEFGDGSVVGGVQPYEALRDAALAAGATPAGGAPLGPEDALRRFGRMATPEVAAVCGLPGPRAAAELWRLAEAWRVRPERRLTGELWSLA
jgi:predicted DsbA family dithiol-disulfide isomerase